MKATKFTGLFSVFFFFLGFVQEVSAQSDLTITVDRSYQTDECTQGYMFVNGEAICYTLELPWKDNQNSISCIPIGEYPGILRYDKNDGWRIQLENVPNRTAVQIHMGNYPKHTEGCVLVGTTVDECAVYNSADAYNKLKLAFYGSETPNSTPNVNIVVKIVE